MNNKFKAFTLIELLVVISIIALLIGILLPALGAARRTARQMQNSTQVRGIHSGIVLFSQGNNTYYPGLNTKGGAGNIENDDGTAGDTPAATTNPLDVQNRFRILLDDNYFTGEYIISPSETKTKFATTYNVGAMHYSYAMLQIDTDEDHTTIVGGERNKEWRDTSNSEAVVISDRAKANGTAGNIKSVHTNPSSATVDEWRGSVGFNDNHVTFEATHNGLTTQYGNSTISNDNLFVDTDKDSKGSSDNDGAMAYTGVTDRIDGD